MADILIISLCILVWIATLFKKEYRFENMFGSSVPLPWWVTGFSLTVISLSVTYVVLLSGIVYSTGFHGLWWVFISNMGVGLAAFIFAHYWSRSGVKTDNQIVRLRFSGKGSKILQQFRAGYVGLLVFPLLSAQMTVAFAGYLSIYTGLDYTTSLFITCALILANITRTTFYSKVRMDVYMGLLLCVVFFLVALWFLVQVGSPSLLGEAITKNIGPQHIIPHPESAFMLSDFLVLIFVAWWSTYILDGAGLQAQRYLQMNNHRDLVLGALFQGLALALITGLLLFIVSTATFYYPDLRDGEEAFFRLLSEQLPGGLRGLFLVAIGIAYLTTLEAFINLAGSYIMVDILGYDKAHYQDVKKRRHTYLLIILLSIFVVILALIFESVEQIFRFILVITAGVGPVYLLRWWWWRINAWSQLSAMVSSIFYAIFYEVAYANWVFFEELMDMYATTLGMQSFTWKILILTIFVIITWVSVTLLTPADDKNQLQKFYNKVRPHGCWKPFSDSGQSSLIKLLAMALLVGFALIALHFILYPFLFGFNVTGLLVLILTSGLIWVLIRRFL